MKALIVDPDRTSRAAIKRLFTHVNVDCHEAENGLVALNQLEQLDPDFIVLEIDMPILSGPDTLAAVRQSPTRPDVPAIVISSSGTRDVVMRMVALGVADYLVKPINPVDVLPRIKHLLLRAAQWRQRHLSRTINDLLIVDADPNFLAFVRPLLGVDFTVHEAPSSTTAAVIYRDAPTRPTVVCLAEGLPLMNEDLLVDVIRKLALEAGDASPQFFLLARSDDLPQDKVARYAGVIRKSFLPEQFLGEFRSVVLREQESSEQLRRHLRDSFALELESAVLQTVGAMQGGDLQALPGETVSPYGVLSRLDLRGHEHLVLRCELSGAQDELERLASRIARREVTLADGVREVLGELATAVAERVRSGLLPGGFHLELGSPEILEAEGAAPTPTEYDLTGVFQCREGETFRVSLQVIQGVVTAGPSAPAHTEATGAPAARAGVDDVLLSGDQD